MEIIDHDIQDAEEEASPDHYPQNPLDQNRPGATSDLSSDTLAGLSHLRTRRSHPVELERIATYRTIHSSTVGAQVNSRPDSIIRKVTTLGAGKVFAPADYNVEDFLVEFDGHDDPLHPQNWPMRKK
jgi:MFS transporter, DHA1 family, multidrug resistance protein